MSGGRPPRRALVDPGAGPRRRGHCSRKRATTGKAHTGLRFELHDLLTGDGHIGDGHIGHGHIGHGHIGHGHIGHGHAVALVKDLAERADGRSLAMNNVHVWHVGDGRLKEIWVYPGDLGAWDDFWS